LRIREILAQLNSLLLNVMFASCLNMVFNYAMTKDPASDADRQTIDRLGGPTKLAELLGYDKRKGGVQRIQNWKERGIPPGVKLMRPDLFLPELVSGGTHGAASDGQGTANDEERA
jgi:hypothetical protein